MCNLYAKFEDLRLLGYFPTNYINTCNVFRLNMLKKHINRKSDISIEIAFVTFSVTRIHLLNCAVSFEFRSKLI